MTMTSTASETVILKGGLSVPLAALRVLWDFESRGLTVKLDQTGWLLVGPRLQLTASDRAAISQHRDMLVAIVRCCDEVAAPC